MKKTLYYTLTATLFSFGSLWAQEWQTNGNDIHNTNSENVGIGTTSPNESLEVAGTGRVFIGDGGGTIRRGILFQGTGTYARILAHDYGLSTGVDLVLQDSGGKVGIGITPNESLEVGGTGRVFVGDGGGTIRRGILFQGTGTYARILAHDYGLSSGVDLILQDSGGKVGIGTTTMPGNHKLYVDGSAVMEEVKVALSQNWPDFVFNTNYPLPTLTEVETHIKENGHLKDIPSEAEVKANGIHLGEMDAKLLQKIEELTLYTIAQDKTLKGQQELLKTQAAQNAKQQQLIEKLVKRIETLENK